MSEPMKPLTPLVERDLAPGAQRKHNPGIGATLLAGLLTLCLLSGGELLYAGESTAIQPSAAGSFMKQNLSTTNFGAQTAMTVSPAIATKWTTTDGAIQTRPTMISLDDSSLGVDVAYVGSNDGRVYAYDTKTGQPIWVTPVAGSVNALVDMGGIIRGGIAVQLKKYANDDFTLVTDLVFVGTRERSTTANKVYALNANTGAIVWTFSPGNMDAVNSTPVVDYANNVIWVTSLSNGNGQPSLWKINGLTGAGISDLSLGDISGSPTLNGDNKVVYAVTDSGNLVAVRNDLFSCSNTLATGATTGTGFPIPINCGAVRDDYIYFTTTTSASSTVRKARFSYGVDCSGSLAAASGYTNPSFSSITLSGPMFNPLTAAAIYVGASDGKLYKVDPASGAVLDSRTVSAGITIGEPGFDVFLKRLYFGDAQGRVYSFDVF